MFTIRMHHPMTTPFGKTADGREVQLIPLECGNLSCGILTYGAVLQNLLVPDSDGFDTDVVLGYENVNSYEELSGRMGAVIGRYANRIANARFELGGRTYELSRNRGPDHIHGGFSGFDRKIWDVKSVSGRSVTLSLSSPDGDEGYPGNIDVEVTYTLDGDSLSIGYTARSDEDTVCNLTNHSYFNLNGHNRGTVEDNYVSINSSRHTVLGDRSLPTGEIAPVDGTPLDLRQARSLGTRLRKYGGFDNNYLLDGRKAATVYAPKSGITMEVETDSPAVQFYTANGLKNVDGKYGSRYGKWSGLCLETQECPDAPNRPEFPPAVLRKGETYRRLTRFVFSSEQE